MKSATSTEHMKQLALESSNADSHFQQLDKLRMIYEEYIKLGKESIPLAEKKLKELTEEMRQKSQALDDVTHPPYSFHLDVPYSLSGYISSSFVYFTLMFHSLHMFPACGGSCPCQG